MSGDTWDRRLGRRRSGGSAALVDEAAETIDTLDRPRGVGVGDEWDECVDVCTAVGPSRVVVLHELVHDLLKVTAPGDEDPVQAFPAGGADESFREGVGLRSAYQGFNDRDVVGDEDGVEGGDEPHRRLCCPPAANGTTAASDAFPAFPVGTALAGGPPDRSQRAELPHWAPALGAGVKPDVRPGMHDPGCREPPRFEPAHPLPGQAVTLAPVP